MSRRLMLIGKIGPAFAGPVSPGDPPALPRAVIAAHCTFDLTFDPEIPHVDVMSTVLGFVAQNPCCAGRFSGSP